jgi:hypothetical protein
VLWGAAWTRVFGESFEVLRASTLVLGAITLVVIHEILRRANVSRFARLAGTLAFAFHPLFLWASCTYMTEVPFVCVSAIAFFLIWRGIEDESAEAGSRSDAAAIVSAYPADRGDNPRRRSSSCCSPQDWIRGDSRRAGAAISRF